MPETLPDCTLCLHPAPRGPRGHKPGKCLPASVPSTPTVSQGDSHQLGRAGGQGGLPSLWGAQDPSGGSGPCSVMQLPRAAH